MATLGLAAFEASTQTYPRKQDWLVVNALAGLCGSLHKFAFDLRLLQSPADRRVERAVRRETGRVQRHAVQAQPDCGGERGQPGAAGGRVAARDVGQRGVEPAGAHAGRFRQSAHGAAGGIPIDRRNRDAMPPGWSTACRSGQAAVQRNLDAYGAFAGTERVLMEAVKAGGDRQELHEVIREQSLAAWADVQAGRPNPLPGLLAGDTRDQRLLSAETDRGTVATRRTT